MSKKIPSLYKEETEPHTSSKKKSIKNLFNTSLKKKIGILMFLIIVLVILLTILGNPFSEENISHLSSNSIEKGNLSVTFTGDVMFGRKTSGVLSSGESPYRYVSNVTGQSDILVVNTENPFTTSSNSVKPDVPLKADPAYINLLNGTNYTLISANANNHVFDYGVEGMEESIKHLDEASYIHIGAGENKTEATEPITLEQNGHKITVFNYMDSENFVEYSNDVLPAATDNSAGYSAWDDSESVKQIQEAKNNGSDFVVVYMHYGNEYSRSPNQDQMDISHKAIDAGADAVVGSHAHVTQGIEMYHNKPIFYNLGNFIFDQSNTATHRAYFVNFNISNDNVTANVYPIDIINYLPHFMSASDGKTLLEELNPQCSELTITDQGTGILNFKIGNNTTN